MLRARVSKNAGAATSYFTSEFSREELLAGEGEKPGKWFGKAAELLGLNGDITKAAFARLAHNVNPGTGERLTPRSPTERRAGFDFTFNLPKSVSLAWSLLQDERVPEVTYRAAVFAMEKMEREAAARVRRGGADHDVVTGNLAASLFLHYTTRPVAGTLDPQIHLHAFIHNTTYDETEARFKALQPGVLWEKLPLYEAFFHHQLAAEMQDLGYEIQPLGRFWEIKGFSRPLIEAFSGRSEVIQDWIGKAGIEDPQQKDAAGARTRERKVKGYSLESLKAEWRERAEDLGFDPGRVPTSNNAPRPDKTAEAVRFAAGKLLERSAVIPERKLVEEAMRYAPGCVDLTTLRRHYNATGIFRRELDGQGFISSAEAAREEQKLVALARAGKGALEPVTYKIQLPRTASEYDKVLTHIIGSQDSVVVLEGKPGTGKTTLAKELAQICQERGWSFVAVAPTTAARDTLKLNGFETAETVAKLFADETLQKTMRHAVVWVDETSLLSIKDAGRVLELGREYGSRLLFVGDEKGQHRSVVRGGVLHTLTKHAGIEPAQLSIIKRQSGRYADATTALSGRRLREAEKILREMNSIHELSAPECRKSAVKAYVDDYLAGKDVLLVTATKREREELNRLVREELTARGKLGVSHARTSLEDKDLTIAEKQELSSYRRGQRIVFHRPCRSFPFGTIFNPGENWKVMGQNALGHVVVRRGMAFEALPLNYAKHFSVYEAVTTHIAIGDRIQITRNTRAETLFQKIWNELPKNRRPLHVELKNGSYHDIKDLVGETIILKNGARLPFNFGHLRNGYCQTTYSAQSQAASKVIACFSMGLLAEGNYQMFNVAVSRGRNDVKVFTAPHLDLFERLSDEESRITSLDLAAGRMPDEVQQRVAERDRAAAKEKADRELADAIRFNEERHHEMKEAQQRAAEVDQGIDRDDIEGAA